MKYIDLFYPRGVLYRISPYTSRPPTFIVPESLGNTISEEETITTKTALKSQLGTFKMTHVFDIVLHHNQSIDAATKGEAGIFVRVDISGSKYVRMDHAAA
jgi:hypothetical protein